VILERNACTWRHANAAVGAAEEREEQSMTALFGDRDGNDPILNRLGNLPAGESIPYLIRGRAFSEELWAQSAE